MNSEFDLVCRFDSRKSFYGKARVKETPTKLYLISYSTIMLELNKKTGKVKFCSHDKDDYSNTTLRHINEFLKQFTDFDKMTKSQMFKMAGIKKEGK